jgi:hypothetical protein
VESDETQPINVYGRTKLAGERAVLAASPSFAVVRTSWIFGSDKPSFPDAVIRNALATTELHAIADKWSCPSYSEDLAAWMEPMIADDRYRGVLHLCNEGLASWQDYAEAALEMAAEQGVPVKTTKVKAVSRLGFPGWKAQRPEHTALNTQRFQTLSGISPRPWREALREHISRQHANFPGSLVQDAQRLYLQLRHFCDCSLFSRQFHAELQKLRGSNFQIAESDTRVCAHVTAAVLGSIEALFIRPNTTFAELIKLASTWEGILAARHLEKEGIRSK